MASKDEELVCGLALGEGKWEKEAAIDRRSLAHSILSFDMFPLCRVILQFLSRRCRLGLVLLLKLWEAVILHAGAERAA